MESFQSILLAECVMRERQERTERASMYDNVVMHEAQEPALRETVAGALIALAQWLAPNHAALSVEHR